MNRFWDWIKNEVTEEPELWISGEIAMEDDFWSSFFGLETVTPGGFMSSLAEHKGKNITVWINSYGGDVFAASRIYTAIKEHTGNVTVKIDGTAFSAASVIAMAGNQVKMSPTALMMIHNPMTVSMGDSRDLQHDIEVLNEVKESIINAYQLKTGKSRNKISEMMDDETYLSAKTALSMGFIDEIMYQENPENEVGIDQLATNIAAYARKPVFNSALETARKIAEYRNHKNPIQLGPDISGIHDIYRKKINALERMVRK